MSDAYDYPDADAIPPVKPNAPHALTREQVEKILCRFGIDIRAEWRGDWKALGDNNATLRQALAQQAQELAYWKQQAAHFTKRCAEQGDSIAEDRRLLDQQAQEIEAIRNTLGCHRAYIIESINDLKAKTDDIPNIDRMRQAEQEVERLKHEKADLVQRNQILRTRPDLPMTHEDKAAFKRLEQQLAASQQKVRELEEEKANAEPDTRLFITVTDHERQLATLQATLAERERELHQKTQWLVDISQAVAWKDSSTLAQAIVVVVKALESNLDTARQDAARLRSILQAILNADERGQGLPFQEAMQQAQKALKGA